MSSRRAPRGLAGLDGQRKTSESLAGSGRWIKPAHPAEEPHGGLDPVLRPRSPVARGPGDAPACLPRWPWHRARATRFVNIVVVPAAQWCQRLHREDHRGIY